MKTTKTMKKLIAAAIVLVGFTSTSSAQSSATGTATATAIIVAPITIANAAHMHFGDIVTSAALGTVVLSPAAARITTGGVSLPVTTTPPTAASFNVGGTASYTFNITLPSSAITLTHSGGSATGTMTIGTFTTDKSLTSNTLASGLFNFNVGATLSVGASQAAGTYTTLTPFEVTVAYN
jgi:hypothetical protein